MIELLLVQEGPNKFTWQSTLPPDEVAHALRAAAERLEEQIMEGTYDKQLAAVGH
jgi:hypothetical protein